MKTRMLAVLLCLTLCFSSLPAIAHADEVNVTQYSYEIRPVLVPFPYYLYVKTDNPDPGSFRLVDRESAYYQEGDHSEICIFQSSQDNVSSFSTYYLDPGTYYIAQESYPDVSFEKPDVWRVAGGYIFKTLGAYSDGGELVLQQRLPGGSSITDWKYEDTSVRIPCAKLLTYDDYVIETYTDSSMSFFEKLDAVQNAVNQLAVYPFDVYDSSKPNESRPYPFLATSPYPELDFNDHYELMYAELQDGLLAYKAYPYVLDSASFPGLMRLVAKKLDPTCEVDAGLYHYMIDVSCNGETKTYGGAGSGGNDPLFSERAKKSFRFDGSGSLDNAGLSDYRAQLMDYKSTATEDITDYRDLLMGEAFRTKLRETGGTWVRVATEGFGLGTTFGYVVPLGDSYRIVSDAWVGGRYVSRYERVSLGVSFDEHPTSSVVVRQLQYTDKDGVKHCQDVIFDYDSNTDTWRAPFFYANANWYSGGMELPKELILSKDQVKALVDAEEGKHLPTSGLIYDGTVYPGTPFTLVSVTGITLAQKTLEVAEGQSETLAGSVVPKDAYTTRIIWTSSDPEIVEVGEKYGESAAYVVGKKPGTATVTATSVDGGYTATCQVTVSAALANPELLSAEYSAKGVTVTWAASKGAEKYRVFRRGGEGGWEWEAIGDTTELSFIDTTAQSSHSYYYYTVRCVSADGTRYLSPNNDNSLGVYVPFRTPGDVNEDGEVNGKDVTRLCRYLAGYSVWINELNADANADGVVNGKDLTRLCRFLAGYPVELK